MMGQWWTISGLPMLLLLCWSCNDRQAAADLPRVQIKNGTLEGTLMRSRSGREIFAFKGIPYAQPPLGELRFEAPQPFDSWSGVRSAKDDPKMCIQRDIYTHQEKIVGVEDCLYLNVYSPNLITNNQSVIQKYYPVMIWLHGGGWVCGTSNSESFGPKFLLDHEIVLVTPNYRLGPLGFLSTEDLVSPGNQGMKDQSLSIRWVHENIAAFGGDVNRITIFGESAGGVSTHYHVISPLSRGLFHRAISQSGTVHCPWALTRPGIAWDHAKKLGNLLECPTNNSTVLVNCLRQKDPAEIIATDRAFQVFDYCPMIPFRVVIEPDHPGAFIKEEPVESLKSGNVADVPWLTGTTSHEGALKVAGIYGLKDKGYDKQLDENFMELAPISLLYEDTCPEEFKENVTRSIRKFYLGDKKIDDSTRMKVVDLYTDAWFFVAADNSVREHFKALDSPIYYYYFAYRGNFSLSSVFGDSEKDYGVCHGDEVQYLFPTSKRLTGKEDLSEEDYKMVDVMTRLWVNFARWGNPTPDESTDNPAKWLPVNTSNLEYLHIGGTGNIGMAAALYPDRINFWTSLPYRANVGSTKP